MSRPINIEKKISIFAISKMGVSVTIRRFGWFPRILKLIKI